MPKAGWVMKAPHGGPICPQCGDDQRTFRERINGLESPRQKSLGRENTIKVLSEMANVLCAKGSVSGALLVNKLAEHYDGHDITEDEAIERGFEIMNDLEQPIH